VSAGNGSEALELRSEQIQLRVDLTKIQAEIRSVLERVAHVTQNSLLVTNDLQRQIVELTAMVAELGKNMDTVLMYVGAAKRGRKRT
jgi:hypothetical protein